MKHTWKKNSYDDSIDTFAFEDGFHNGPECTVCGRKACHHCFPAIYDEECPSKGITHDDSELKGGEII